MNNKCEKNTGLCTDDCDECSHNTTIRLKDKWCSYNDECIEHGLSCVDDCNKCPNSTIIINKPDYCNSIRLCRLPSCIDCNYNEEVIKKQTLPKSDILEEYTNVIYLGNKYYLITTTVQEYKPIVNK